MFWCPGNEKYYLREEMTKNRGRHWGVGTYSKEYHGSTFPGRLITVHEHSYRRLHFKNKPKPKTIFTPFQENGLRFPARDGVYVPTTVKGVCKIWQKRAIKK
jgi:hypothetical protein